MILLLLFFLTSSFLFFLVEEPLKLRFDLVDLVPNLDLIVAALIDKLESLEQPTFNHKTSDLNEQAAALEAELRYFMF